MREGTRDFIVCATGWGDSWGMETTNKMTGAVATATKGESAERYNRRNPLCVLGDRTHYGSGQMRLADIMDGYATFTDEMAMAVKRGRVVRFGSPMGEQSACILDARDIS